MISEFTIEGRKAVNILADTYGLAVFKSGSKDHVRITCDHVRRVAQISRLVPYVTEKASDTPVVGKVFGLGVAGYLGSAIESKPSLSRHGRRGRATTGSTTQPVPWPKIPCSTPPLSSAA